jgi:hypothetical protein
LEEEKEEIMKKEQQTTTTQRQHAEREREQFIRKDKALQAIEGFGEEELCGMSL